jgi:LAO/AO transport system kinase
VWSPPVITVSGLANEDLDVLWRHILDHRGRLEAAGELTAKRRAQEVRWMWTLVDERLQARLRNDPAVRERVPQIEADVAAGTTPATVAAAAIAELAGLGD